MNTNEFARTLLLGIKNLLSWIGIPRHLLDKLDEILFLVCIVTIAFVVAAVVHLLLVRAARKILKRKHLDFFDSLFRYSVFRKSTALIPPLIVSALLPFAFATDSAWFTVSERVTWIYFFIVLMISVNAILNTVGDTLKNDGQLKNRPIKGFIQIFQVIFSCVVVIVVVSILIDKSPARLLAGLGASAAILMLVFKDSIMGLVSGIQLTANDMLHVGDWISMSKYGVNGRVTEVTLNTVKIQNFDNTVTTVPPFILTGDSFQNWRWMQESGGRRIMRSINIDLGSVRFCTPEMTEKYKDIELLHDYIVQRETEFDRYRNGAENPNGADFFRLTNLTVFRAYLNLYLKKLAVVNHELTCMVRHLQPTPNGIPVEVYCFSVIKEWVAYESVQADLFDHIIAVVPEFDLVLFQNPSGNDIQRIFRPARNVAAGA